MIWTHVSRRAPFRWITVLSHDDDPSGLYCQHQSTRGTRETLSRILEGRRGLRSRGQLRLGPHHLPGPRHDWLAQWVPMWRNDRTLQALDTTACGHCALMFLKERTRRRTFRRLFPIRFGGKWPVRGRSSASSFGYKINK